jgi:hypothetical protein
LLSVFVRGRYGGEKPGIEFSDRSLRAMIELNAMIKLKRAFSRGNPECCR